MSETDEQIPTTEEPAKAKKKVAKKAAKKAAKKTAKKATKKTAKVTEEAPISQKAAAQTEAPKDESSSEEKPRMGRVKGGGRIKREKAPAEAQETQDAPEPAENKDSDGDDNDDRDRRGRGRNRNRRGRNRRQRDDQEGGDFKREPAKLEGPPVEVEGMLELSPKGFGFLRVQSKDYAADSSDCFVPPEFVRKNGLRSCVFIKGMAMKAPKGLQLTELKSVNGATPDSARKLPHFDELKAINPSRRISFEDKPERHTTRVLDIVAPVARGQRGLIVSPPRSGKTTLLSHIAEALQEKYEEQIHLMILLIDERPEEVTEFKRLFPDAEIFCSSNDQPHSNHTRLAELCVERAKRLVEAGQDVFLLMDSITRLARAYNGGGGDRGGRGRKGKRGGGGYQSGGIVAGALEMPRRLFAAARDTKTAGSLTILATALVQTNSKADELIFQEFKGTGNMELVLDRRIAEQYLFPAVDIFRSGTRREELIMPEHMLHKIHLIRRGLSGHKPEEAIQRLLYFIKKFPNNNQMLLEIKG